MIRCFNEEKYDYHLTERFPSRCRSLNAECVLTVIELHCLQSVHTIYAFDFSLRLPEDRPIVPPSSDHIDLSAALIVLFLSKFVIQI